MSLFWLLLSSGQTGLTRQYIREHLDDYAQAPSEDAFERKFSRDRENLRSLGVPVRTLGAASGADPEDDDAGAVRYRIDQDQLTLPELEFSAQERLALARARSLWEGTAAHRDVVRALGRLDSSAALQLPDDAPPTDTFAAQLAGADRILTELEAHIRRDEVIRFAYRGINDSAALTRVVRPWLVLAAAGQWYLVGWDLERQSQRMYRVTRMESTPTPHGQENRPGPDRARPADLDVAALLRAVHGESAQETAELWLAPGRAQTLRVGARALGTVPSGPQEGWDRVELDYSRPAEFAARIAAAGAAALVPVSEPTLRTQVIALVDAALLAQQEPAPAHRLTKVPRPRQRAGDREKVGLLVDIVGLVNQRGVATREELKARLGLGDRELDAQLDVLKFCGMPERLFAGEQFEVEEDETGVRIHRSEQLARPVQLSTPEAMALLSGLRLVEQLPGLRQEQAAAARTARERIEGAISEEARRTAQALHMDVGLSEHAALAGQLHRAVEERRVVQIGYHSASRDAHTQRTVEPLRLTAEGGLLYLRAWCREVQGLRTFRLDRISSCTVSTEQFSRVHREASGPVFTGRTGPDAPAPLTVTVRFAHRIRELATAHRATHTAALPDGGVVAQVPVASTEYLGRLAAQHGGEVAVLEPAELREQVIDWLQAARGAYAETAS